LLLAFAHGVFEGDESGLVHWPQRYAALLARFSEVRA
jgi:hypothetical protein